MIATRIGLAGLDAIVIGPADAPITVVLMHGFGASGEDLVGLVEVFDVPARFVFPAAPLELGGLYGDSRAWWMIDFEQLERDLQRGIARDRSAEIPEGMAEARGQLGQFLDQLAQRFSIAADRLVLGGFSQGAMLALDVALHQPAPPRGLVLMSGTLIAETEWSPRLPRLAGVPVFQSHGRRDMLLPFALAEILRDQLRGAGASVDWHEFDGGHEIPMSVLAAATSFLRGATADLR